MERRMKETKNYIWKEEEKLGEGSFGQVFRGVDKRTGVYVAIKKFKDASKFSNNEFEILSKIDHKNIVKLVAYESELRDGQPVGIPVVIMELCKGGSLEKMLLDPENCFGLEDDEYLLLLEGLTSAYEYLRKNNILHRDTKPGNILRHKGDDGDSIYKLADFDAARELADGETFESLRGTAEYLDPYMYGRCMLRSNYGRNNFPASTDLWSIGVTLYQTASGMLPFRIIGKNQDKMFSVINNKSSGVISAYQIRRNDSVVLIEETELPKNCLMSPALKNLMCPLLASLMESNQEKKLSYAEYFIKAQKIVAKKKVHVFFVNKVEPVRVYIEPENSLQELRNILKELTETDVENQVLLYREYLLEDDDSVPETLENCPIFMWDSSNFEIDWKEVPCLKPKMFPNIPDVDGDKNCAKHNCSVAHMYRRLVQDLMRRYDHIQLYTSYLNQVIVTQSLSISKESQLIKATLVSLNSQLEMMQEVKKICENVLGLLPGNVKNHDNLRKILNDLQSTFEGVKSEFIEQKRKLDSIQPAVDKLLERRVEKNQLLEEWRNRVAKINKISRFHKFETESSAKIYEIRTSFKSFHELKYQVDNRFISKDVNDWLIMERIKLQSKMVNFDKSTSNCQKTFEAIVKTFSDWFKTAEAVFKNPKILIHDIGTIRNDVNKLETQLNESFCQYKQKLSMFSEEMFKAKLHQKRSQKQSQNKLGNISKQLIELNEVHQTILQSFEVNKNLFDQLNTILKTSEDPIEKYDQ